MPDVTSLFSGRYLSLHEIDGWEYATRPNATAVVCILAITDNQEIILVEQYRRPVQSRVLEIPAGLVGDEPEFAGESLADTARRELLEETGYTAEEMLPLLTSPTSAGMTDEFTHFFLAKGLTKTTPGGGVAGENITTHKIPLSDLNTFFRKTQSQGVHIDSKIHAALWSFSSIE